MLKDFRKNKIQPSSSHPLPKRLQHQIHRRFLSSNTAIDTMVVYTYIHTYIHTWRRQRCFRYIPKMFPLPSHVQYSRTSESVRIQTTSINYIHTYSTYIHTMEILENISGRGSSPTLGTLPAQLGSCSKYRTLYPHVQSSPGRMAREIG